MHWKNLLTVSFCAVFCFFSGIALAQNGNVSGTVTDQTDGTTLIGVSVKIKGTNLGTSTGPEGTFKISVPETATTLVFTYIGYNTQEVAIDGRATINVAMVASSTSLSEVVVVGYGTQRKVDVTGATASVSAKDLNAGVINNPLQAVQGKVAGLNIVSGGGDPTNNRPSIRLRGTSSLSANSEPLIVIDGVAGASLNSVAPEDIEQIDVLKDASAAAIYGSRGANGVIIVTTKRGKAGKTTVEVNSYVGMEQISNTLPFLSPDQYVARLSQQNLDVSANDYGARTNWFDAITRDAISHNQNLAVSGGTENFNYRGSIVYMDQPGIARNSGMDRLNGRLNLTQKALDDKLEVQLLLSQQQSNRQYVDYFSFLLAGRINPTFPIYNDAGSFLQPGVAGFDEYNGDRIPGGFEIENPLARMEQLTSEAKQRETLGNLKVFLTPVKGLRFGVNTSINSFNENVGYFRPSTYKAAGNNLSLGRRNSREVIDRLTEATGQYTQAAGKHNFDLLAGYTYQKLSNEGFNSENTGFPDVFGYNQLSAGNNNADGSTNRVVGSYKSEAILVGFIGRLNYAFDDKYLLTANIRRDGSSRFGENNQWGWFPSVSAGWRLKQEKFLANADFISELKLRVGYGVTGNQEGIYDYASKLLYGPQGAFFTNGGFQTAYRYSQNANPDLQWETSAMTNIGLDFGFLNGRLNGSLEFYEKNTKDLLFDYGIAIGSTYGANNLTAVTNSILANVGKINNRGVELALDYLAVDKDNFQWRTNVNLAHNQNKVESLTSGIFAYDPASPRTYGGYGSGQGGIAQPVVLQEGYPIGQFFGPRFLGFGTNDDGTPRYIWEDFGGGGNDPFGRDRTYLGSAQPDLIFAWGNNFTYKRFDFNFLLRGAVGHQIVNGPYIYSANPNRFPGNNAITDAFSTGIPEGLSPAFSSLWVEDGDFVRLDNFRLSYRLPNFAKYLTNAQVYVAGNNTFVLTKYRGIDPEPRLGSSRDVYGSLNTDQVAENLSPGIEPITYYPKTRSFSLGVSLTF